MKKNDLIALVVALALLVGAGYYYISQNGSSATTASTTANQVEVVPTINPTLDANGTLDKLNTTYKVQDYKQPVDLSGLGNTAPFGQ